ncbi:MAG: CsiV family protein [Pseudomonadota bacterium]
MSMHKIIAGLLLCALASSTLADDLYKVELIVFENLDPAAQQAERWPVDPGLPALDNALELAALSAAPEKNQWRLLKPAELAMGGVYQRLRASPRYRPVLHTGWVQPLDNTDRKAGVHIYSGMQNEAPATAADVGVFRKINGTVGLRRGRFLHTDVDLIYTMTAPGADANSGATPPVRLITIRRLRNNEVHYLDHPLFGVIISVNPLDGDASRPQ